jgi:3-isopropylmalate dehydrogenase
MAKTYPVVVLGGEGIGPEVCATTVPILRRAGELFGVDLTIESFEVGVTMLEKVGTSFPKEAEAAVDAAQEAGGAILFGAVSDEPIGILRKQYDLFANLRPIRTHAALAARSPLKRSAIDMLVVRELVSGIYYGPVEQGAGPDGRWASQALRYSEGEVRRIARVAFEQARMRRRKVTYVHKGNVIKEVFQLWREIVDEVHASFADVELEDILVDNMAMQMVLRPETFDVVLAENLFGDILSDLGAGIVGSIGMLPSASMNARGFGLFESIGGTAPAIAGKGIANPCSTILSAAMMCRNTFKSEPAALAIERAVDAVLERHRTADVMADGCELVSTTRMGELVLAALSAAR